MTIFCHCQTIWLDMEFSKWNVFSICLGKYESVYKYTYTESQMSQAQNIFNILRYSIYWKINVTKISSLLACNW